MTKYATQRKYQPYIDIIMKDLGLYGKVDITFVFRSYKTFGGDAMYNKVFKTGVIRIDNAAEHQYVLETLMHEIRHIWQVYTGIRTGHFWSQYTNANGEFEELDCWKGKIYKVYNHAVQRQHKEHKLYMNSPWEIDANRYEKKRSKLFPNNNLQQSKIVGKVGKATFYKVAT